MSKNQVIQVKEPKISKMLSTKLDVDEICEWAHISGDQPTLENDSEFDNRQIFQLKRHQFVKASIKLNERFNQNQGNTIKLNENLANNLKGKASIIAQQNSKNEQQKEEKLDSSENNTVQICKGEESHDKGVFRCQKTILIKMKKNFNKKKEIELLNYNQRKQILNKSILQKHGTTQKDKKIQKSKSNFQNRGSLQQKNQLAALVCI